jgi:hypothetical protein
VGWSGGGVAGGLFAREAVRCRADGEVADEDVEIGLGAAFLEAFIAPAMQSPAAKGRKSAGRGSPANSVSAYRSGAGAEDERTRTASGGAAVSVGIADVLLTVEIASMNMTLSI